MLITLLSKTITSFAAKSLLTTNSTWSNDKEENREKTGKDHHDDTAEASKEQENENGCAITDS